MPQGGGISHLWDAATAVGRPSRWSGTKLHAAMLRSEKDRRGAG